MPMTPFWLVVLPLMVSPILLSRPSIPGIEGRDSNIGLTIRGNTTSQNGVIGIGNYFGGDFRGSTIAHNTSNGNLMWGIILSGGSFGNTVTGNIANENGDRGITLYSN